MILKPPEQSSLAPAPAAVASGPSSGHLASWHRLFLRRHHRRQLAWGIRLILLGLGLLLGWLGGTLPLTSPLLPPLTPAPLASSPSLGSSLSLDSSVQAALTHLPLPPPLPLRSQSPSSSSPRPLELMGHRHYDQAATTHLMVISSYGTAQGTQRFERLHQEAALALMQLIDAARADGVWIVPVSGFRDQDRQRQLFEAQIQRRRSVLAAAQSVAPPGYSEHHTGYAVDLADGLARAKDISRRFVDTPAFDWLVSHGQDFGFELSFPPNNAQKIDFEPWHWRYTGSAHAQRLFKDGSGQHS